MIAIDSNILVYSHAPESGRHAEAVDSLQMLGADIGTSAVPRLFF